MRALSRSLTLRVLVGRPEPSIVLVLLALLVPVLVADVPPLQDYPNHLARIWLVGGGAALTTIADMYRVTFDTFTNIGIDLGALVLTPVFGYDAVGRLFVAGSVLLPPLGGVVLWRVLHGRMHWWQLSFALLAWSMGVMTGFLNFENGLGLALLAAAADPAIGRRHPAVALACRSVLGALLMVVHIFAFAFYAALLCGMAFGASWRPWSTRAGIVRGTWSVLAVIAAVAVPMVLLVTFAPSLPGQQVGTNAQSVWADFHGNFVGLLHPATKIKRAFLGIRAYGTWLDVLTIVALLLPVLVSAALRRLSVHAGMAVVSAGLLLLYFLTPLVLAGTWWIDTRFAMMAPFALAAALRPDLPRRLAPRLAPALAIGLLAVSLLRTGVVGWVWHARQSDVASVRRALDAMPPGEALLSVEHRIADQSQGALGRYSGVGGRTDTHLPTLALPWRHDFVPTLFSARGEQPVRVLPPWDKLSVAQGGGIASVAALVDPAVLAEDVGEAPYLQDWRTHFRYVLVMNAQVPDMHGPFTPPPGMTLIRDEGFAQLYKVEPLPAGTKLRAASGAAVGSPPQLPGRPQ